MRILVFLSFLVPQIVFAQFSDDFSDGEFTNNPTWSGNDTSWTVVNGQLRSNGPAVTTTVLYLSTPSIISSDCQWEFWANPKLSTSSGNFTDVFLMSDQENLKNDLNGYFVRIGGTSDEVSLYRKQGASSTKIIDGIDGIISGSSNNPTKVKVIRNFSNTWSLEADVSGTGANYSMQGTIADSIITSSAYFGVLVNYSSANNQKYYFDDFYAGPIITDTVSPSVTSIKVISSTQLDIYFDEILSQASAENLSNYSVNNGIGTPNTASRDISSPSLVHLTFSVPFNSGITNTIVISNIADPAGNISILSAYGFLFFKPGVYDITINEIMPDPSPANGLPEQEFIELHNKTAYPVNLNNWKVKYGSTSKTLPDVTILPDSFLLLCSDAAFAEYSSLENAVNVSGLSSSALTNTGNTLQIIDNYGVVIHSLAYSDNWYGDPAKEDGGWSLEQVDPGNPCGDYKNWKASIDPAGGTPGRKNSVYASNPDLVSPKVTGICIIDSVTIQVNFSENVDSTNAASILGYTVDNGVGNPAGIMFNGIVNNYLILNFSNVFSKDLIYTLTATNQISDCVGNNITGTSVTPFALYSAKEFDLVINEIMADPDPAIELPAFEYVEIYNKSLFPVDISNWSITIGTTTKTFGCIAVQPDEYLIVTNSNNELQLSWYGKTAGVSGLGSLTNTSGSITLTNSSSDVISHVAYSDSWYKSNSKINGGWSLEQMDASNPCGGENNWSASKAEEGGTPGKVNSVKSQNPDVSAPELVRALVLDSIRVRIYFDEPLTKSTLNNTSLYSIDNGIGNPLIVSPVGPDYSSVVLSLANPVVTGVIYSVRVVDSVADCSGNRIKSEQITPFALPEELIAGDIIINEILFNPRTGGVDFVEVYNRSDKVLDLKKINLSSMDTLANLLTSVKAIDTVGYLIFPDEYLVLTTKPEIVKAQYYTSNPKGFVEMSSLPSFSNSDGTVVLSDIYEEVIDRFYYSEELHFPLLNEFKGVSLERINPELPASENSNWHSASDMVGYATPAYKNSQYLRTKEGNSEVYVEPKLFSPDNDGFNDVVTINYKLGSTGNIGNLNIYDSQGQLVRGLVQNELLGTEGTFIWDGINNDREKSNIGIYIIYLEIFDLNGNLKKYKYSCVLGGKI